jgi:thiamine monophosphate kinase
MLAWGNWELILTVRPGDVDALARLAQKHSFPMSVIGEMRDVGSGVWLSSEGKRGRLTNFASERFTGTSYFTQGLESYMRWLIDVPLTEEQL